jgi:hypothetical protein
MQARYIVALSVIHKNKKKGLQRERKQRRKNKMNL